MKRRLFVKKFGQGLSSSIIMPTMLDVKKSKQAGLEYHYPVPQNLEEAKNDEGLVALQLEVMGNSKKFEKRLKGKVQGKKVEIERVKSYFNLGSNVIDTDLYTFNLSAAEGDRHIITFWLGDVSSASKVVCTVNGIKSNIILADLLTNNQFVQREDGFVLQANLLFHNELGGLNPADLNIAGNEENFRFIIMADPQGGDPIVDGHGSNTRMKIHNAFIEDSILTANELSPQPVFALILGDFTDYQGEEENFQQMIWYYEKLNSPILLEIGNHETRYRSEFTPGYNMDAFKNYFAAQKLVNGLQLLVYSFDIGQWHFIVWPDPLRNNFWETHPHYFDWLERDLEKNKEKRTFFFQHVPMHPIGINPLVSYVNAVHINRLMFGILSKHRNVEYVFSGHVHIPLKASVKTAVTYKGINMINLPPTGYRPRAFGEEDLYGGPSQGMCIVDVQGKKVDVSFKTIVHEIFKYPTLFNEYTDEKDPLWFNYKWEIDPDGELVNGDFKAGLKGWMQKFVYREDEHPSNICEVRKAPQGSGNALYMYVRRRDYDKPGQDRLPQTLNQLTQVVKVRDSGSPVIKFKYQVEEGHFNPDSWNGGFLWLEGYHQNHLMLNHVYSIGKVHQSIGGSYRFSHSTWYSYFDIYDGQEGWNEVILNVKADYDLLKKERAYKDLLLDKLVLSFGVWTINKGYKQEAGIFYKDIFVDFVSPDSPASSLLNNREFGLLDKPKIWNGPMSNLAGEHQYVRQEEVYPY